MRIAKFWNEVKSEVLKVVWPTRRDVIISSVLIIIVSACAALFFFAIDYMSYKLIKLILGVSK
ncbi:MAG: preprotein translocase subunit SecE [Proteobacteria bacterium]|nr:preprotein translocase subunit SecE [Pseudomonadota bacterium]